MQTKARALVVMNRSSFEAHFDSVRLARLADLVTLDDPCWTDELDSAGTRGRLREAEVLITSWGAPRLTPHRLAAAPRLKAVLHCAGSVRGLVGREVWRRGITVTSAADANAVPVAEYTLAAIIFAGKKAPFLAADEQRAYGGWGSVTGYGDLSNVERTVGIVGFSRIGRQVVRMLRVLRGTTCLVADPYADPDEVAEAGAELVELGEMLPRVDVLSVHAPELAETHHLIGAEQLRTLPDFATVINTARGSLVDSDALAAECRAGRLFAILDVTDPEPLPADSPLRRLARVMVTPHIAGSLGSEIGRLTDHILDELTRWVDRRPLKAEITEESWALGLSA
ncbi:hydroxyacid dehydrogenase [Streptomyces beihaiensis]|uniref:Hydroxyacid dehydrogenase n=1 Tax=Streptomyces beihaiensis TaxID=2984495 RepID=A0ABT3U0T9_9ACTN|nr:hydroxyacid dehydrogenase [Streptomyces beihaiensis]MCX3062933.1 hydroxyacid dehydrogenase [Streptomyces beihaiensis]